MVIRQGDVFWAQVPAALGSGVRPVLVIQSDAFNRARLNTVLVCALTSQIRWAHAPGNVQLSKREANLPKRSVANVTQLTVVQKSQLAEKIGTLSDERLAEVLEGVRLVTRARWE